MESLKPESFLAVAAVAWADGKLSKVEATGLQRAAQECGLEGEALDAVKHASEEGIAIDDVDLTPLSGWDRALTYAIATWLSQVDGAVNAQEHRSLKALSERLDLPEQKLKAAASAAFDIACLPGGGKPDKYDFKALLERLAVKLPSLSQPPKAE